MTARLLTLGTLAGLAWLAVTIAALGAPRRPRQSVIEL